MRARVAAAANTQAVEYHPPRCQVLPGEVDPHRTARREIDLDGASQALDTLLRHGDTPGGQFEL